VNIGRYQESRIIGPRIFVKRFDLFCEFVFVDHFGTLGDDERSLDEMVSYFMFYM